MKEKISAFLTTCIDHFRFLLFATGILLMRFSVSYRHPSYFAVVSLSACLLWAAHVQPNNNVCFLMREDILKYNVLVYLWHID